MSADHGFSSGNAQSESLVLLKAWLRHAHPPAKDGLMGFVLDAVANIEWPERHCPIGNDLNLSHPAELLMILEVYCYAKGVYDSIDVELRACQSSELGILFQDQPPPASVIRSFRRQHRDLIRMALQEVFDLALSVRFGISDAVEAPADYCVIEAMDHWFEPMCGPNPGREAEQRLEQASYWDGLAEAC